MTTISATTTAARPLFGRSSNPLPKTRCSTASAGHAGHSHGPYHDRIVIPIPNNAAAKPPLMRMSACYSGPTDEALRNVLIDDPRIAFALLFGSTARGDTTPFSDIDVAVGLKTGERLDAYAVGELIARLEQAVGRTVDLVLLDEAPPGIAYRVFRDGRLLVEADHATRINCEVRAILMYLDWQPVERFFTDAVLRAAASNGR